MRWVGQGLEPKKSHFGLISLNWPPQSDMRLPHENASPIWMKDFWAFLKTFISYVSFGTTLQKLFLMESYGIVAPCNQPPWKWYGLSAQKSFGRLGRSLMSNTCTNFKQMSNKLISAHHQTSFSRPTTMLRLLSLCLELKLLSGVGVFFGCWTRSDIISTYWFAIGSEEDSS